MYSNTILYIHYKVAAFSRCLRRMWIPFNDMVEAVAPSMGSKGSSDDNTSKCLTSFEITVRTSLVANFCPIGWFKKLVICWMCIFENVLPMQLRGPALNGVNSYGFLFSRFSGRKRSGLNSFGFSKVLGLWPIAYKKIATLAPLGIILPLARSIKNYY